MAAPQVSPVETPDTEEVPAADRPWVTIVWNDPVNLMSYVTWVFQKLFGYSKEKAEQLMLGVHHDGRAIVSSGPATACGPRPPSRDHVPPLGRRVRGPVQRRGGPGPAPVRGRAGRPALG